MLYIFLLVGVIILGALLITAIILQRRGENAKTKKKYVVNSQRQRARFKELEFKEPDAEIVTLQMDPHGIIMATKKKDSSWNINKEQPEK